MHPTRDSQSVAAPKRAVSDAEQSAGHGLIVRQVDPENLELPFSSLDSFITANEQFYVRNHFQEPELDGRHWRLSVEGAVEQPFELSLDELRVMPSRTLTAVLECSGNGRVFLAPPQTGLRWELGAVSNAEWTGVGLAELLRRARVRSQAREVVLQGADSGSFAQTLQKTPVTIAFARSLPLEKARRPEVLVAYAMNGKPLPRAHGFPVRAVVPGWYGMASVKWLVRVVVTDQPFHGYFQTSEYAIWQRRNGLPSLVPVGEVEVKAQIARPAQHESVLGGSDYRVFGAAWTGESTVTRVEVSDDGAAHWWDARLLGDPTPYAWRLWEWTWHVADTPGRRTLMARATDARGHVQPLERDPLHADAVISHVVPVTVEVVSESLPHP
jgi:DMSO/TMAO reductase YedYZ molybdopterin-dependent catalytic subunit